MSESTDTRVSTISLKSICPICGDELEVVFTPLDLPYFDDIIAIRGTCGCGYSYNDLMITSDGTSSSFEFEVTSCEDLYTKVIRSATCRIKVPELGVEINPGSFAESFITNVEGVLSRIESILEVAMSSATEEGDADRIKNIETISKKIDAVKKGEFKITLILEDEFGNSAIISDKLNTIPETHLS
ncbi:MAG: ZPR1 zinc-finger domain protein [Candidatus Syntrophoarchaeum sp. GoM_oil]|nr:MAG: ZPR1 zinc-finger domain protein [Candidatus Syntrophoarchaeum sp. GoM_oil]